MEKPSVDVILLTYKPAKQVCELIRRLEKQTLPVHKIIIMNTEEKYFEERFYGTRFLEQYKNIEVHHLSSREFDHGRTRDKGISYSEADCFVCMTHDAMPENDRLIEELVGHLYQEKVAVAYARQLPGEDCDEIEKYTRQFNYPDTSGLKGQKDIEQLGIKTFFCSNVCAAYRRDVYDRLGGFIKKTIFNEDMIYAAKVVKAGYNIAYVAEAQVIHSHNYSCMQQLRRNFDLGVSQADHPEVFEGISSTGEGMKLVMNTQKYLLQKKMYWKIPILYSKSAFKFLGYQLGKHYRKLPKKMIHWCTMNPGYWKSNNAW